MATQKLTALKVRHATEPGRYGDGDGLYLRVRENGSRAWLLRCKVPGGKTYDLGLGSVADVTLAEARAAAAAARRKVRAGVDPTASLAAPVEAEPARTFRDVAEAYVTAQEAGWKNPVHRAQWRSTLRTYAYPKLGDMPVSVITTMDVHAVLAPIWTTKTETADRLRGRIERVLASAKALGLRSGENPAAWKENLADLLPPASKLKKVEHHKSLPWERCPAFVALLMDRDGDGARALLLTILCALRTSETLDATWREFDLTTKTWTIPAERMKTERMHRVPLADAAMALLLATPEAARDPAAHVFHDGEPAMPLSNMTMAAVLKRMDVDDGTVHGFRSSFRTWAAESDGSYREDVAEACLAHATKNKVIAAYQRGELFELRKMMMANWARFLLPGGLPNAAVTRNAWDSRVDDPAAASPDQQA